MDHIDLTPTQQVIMTVLSDGLAKTRDQLLAAMGEEESRAREGNLRKHICILREKLRAHNLDVVPINGVGYRLMRTIQSE